MTDTYPATHDHVFLGAGHAKSERRTWVVIALCAFMMVAEIVGGIMFGSIALVADGLHMSTHASALLLAALAYSYARRHSGDQRFTFGTGKLGDLAGFTSAIVLAMIALLIGYEAVSRFIAPVPISFNEAIPIAVLGLFVNVASVLLLNGGHHHGHGHPGQDHHHDEPHWFDTGDGKILLEVFEESGPPRFRLAFEMGSRPPAEKIAIETVRPNGARQVFALADRGDYFESLDNVPEPHEFTAHVRLEHDAEAHSVAFEEHEDVHASAHRDNNMRAAIVHVLADAAVSVLVIVGLLFGRFFGWVWLDPFVGMCGAVVIAAWAYGLIRDTGAILLDMNPDLGMAERVRAVIESDGDRLTDLHLWRLGPGHLGAILSISTVTQRSPEHCALHWPRGSAITSSSRDDIGVRIAADAIVSFWRNE
jgi:cation diffusion facilitator family transporter